MNLSIVWAAAALGVVTALCAARPALAQAPGPALPLIGGPSAITAGVFAASSGDARDRGGSTQIAAEFRYTLPVPNPFVVPTRTVLSLGVQTGARGGSHSTTIPITVAQLFGEGGRSPNAANTFFGGGGVGVYILNQSSLSTATRLGIFPEVGYNITDRVFVDAKYQFVSHAEGLNILAGLRF